MIIFHTPDRCQSKTKELQFARAYCTADELTGQHLTCSHSPLPLGAFQCIIENDWRLSTATVTLNIGLVIKWEDKNFEPE
jgi:hypothetical protein